MTRWSLLTFGCILTLCMVETRCMAECAVAVGGPTAVRLGATATFTFSLTGPGYFTGNVTANPGGAVKNVTVTGGGTAVLTVTFTAAAVEPSGASLSAEYVCGTFAAGQTAWAPVTFTIAPDCVDAVVGIGVPKNIDRTGNAHVNLVFTSIVNRVDCLGALRSMVLTVTTATGSSNLTIQLPSQSSLVDTLVWDVLPNLPRDPNNVNNIAPNITAISGVFNIVDSGGGSAMAEFSSTVSTDATSTSFTEDNTKGLADKIAASGVTTSCGPKVSVNIKHKNDSCAISAEVTTSISGDAACSPGTLYVEVTWIARDGSVLQNEEKSTESDAKIAVALGRNVPQPFGTPPPNAGCLADGVSVEVDATFFAADGSLAFDSKHDDRSK